MPTIAAVSSRAWFLVAIAACAPGPKIDPIIEQPIGWRDQVPLASLPDLDPDPGVVEVELEARVASLEVRPGIPTELWTYSGGLPGPLIRAPRGARLKVHFVNKLPEPTTVHWHGLRVSAAMDGTEAVQTPVPPGGRFDYELDLLDAGTFWYHPHVRSSAQVGYGLYGALIVDDPAEVPLPEELPLVFSDIGIDADGRLHPGDESGWFGDYFGREGNLLLLNGRVRPTIRARAGLPQRWRIVNAARARYMELAAPGVSMVKVATDGGLVEAPLPISTLLLAPGERAEVVAIAQNAGVGRIPILWQDVDRFHIDQKQTPIPLFDLEVTEDPNVDAAPLPERLRTLPSLDLDHALPRRIELTESSSNGVGILGINGMTGPHGELYHAHVGSTEIWTVVNTTGFDHPFHLHGFFFEVLSVDGRPWPTREWRDTFQVEGKSEITFAVQYDDRPGMWMFHCHILDHADLGMMAMLMVMRLHE